MVLVDSNFWFRFPFIIDRLQWQKRDDKAKVEPKIAVNKYDHFFNFTASIRSLQEGNVFSHVCLSVHRGSQYASPNHMDLLKLILLGLPPPLQYIYWQASGCPSTERLPCIFSRHNNQDLADSARNSLSRKTRILISRSSSLRLKFNALFNLPVCIIKTGTFLQTVENFCSPASLIHIRNFSTRN